MEDRGLRKGNSLSWVSRVPCTGSPTHYPTQLVCGNEWEYRGELGSPFWGCFDRQPRMQFSLTQYRGGGVGTDRMPQEYGLVMKQWGTALPLSKMSTLDQRLTLRKLISRKQGPKDLASGLGWFCFYVVHFGAVKKNHVLCKHTKKDREQDRGFICRMKK